VPCVAFALSCYVMLCVMLCYVMLCYDSFTYVSSIHIKLCHDTHHITPHNTTSHHTTSHKRILNHLCHHLILLHNTPRPLTITSHNHTVSNTSICTYMHYQANDVTSSSDVQINQLNQELNTLKEHSGALEEELQSRILVLECSAQASSEELISIKTKAVSESVAESTRLDDLERECDELRQQLAESQSALHGIQASAADEKESLTVERDDLLSQLAVVTVRTTGLSEALAAAQAIINEVRISAGPASHSDEVIGEMIGEVIGEEVGEVQVQAESSESVLYHSTGAMVSTESELSGEVQQRSGEWKVHLLYTYK
jgi:hypothetical protein